MATKTTPAEMRRTATVWDHAILLRGAAAGLAGAGVVAFFFLVLDWLAGEPLRTPALLGSRLLIDGTQGAAAPGGQGLLWVTYTVVHVGAFIAIGAIAAFLAGDLAASRSWRGAVAVAAGLFAAMAALLLAFAALFDPMLIGELGWGAVLVGNALAAAAMTPIVLQAHSDPETLP